MSEDASAIKLRILQMKEAHQKKLPHIYAHRFYKWQREFFESTNPMILLTAANQIGKSTVQIKKVIELATNQALWPVFWPGKKPNLFWYLYPDKITATFEWKTKWLPLMPAGEYKDHKLYGWKEHYANGKIESVEFNSGVILVFKAYGQDVQNLQSGTVFYVACFTKGTEIITPRGIVPVENIKVGDLVLSKDGFKIVRRTMQAEKPVLTRKFSNGKSLTGTIDHPIWTENRGWVQLGELQSGDICCTVPEWLLRFQKILSWFYLKGFYLKGNQTIQIQDKETTSVQAVRTCTQKFGKSIISGVFQRAALFIIEMGMRSTIGQRISSSLREQNTPRTTSGKSGGLGKSTPVCVIPVEKSSFQEAPTQLSVGAPKGVENGHIWPLAFVRFVRKIFHIGRIKKTCFVLDNVPISAVQEIVYNLEVEGSHTYYANGILTHNCDEELPEELYGELSARTQACDGYFSMVFTATLGQEHWRLAMEPRENETQNYPTALKLQVSLYDCMKYEDGSLGQYNEAKINRAIQRCGTTIEVLRRVHGKFVVAGGRRFEAFTEENNVKEAHPIPDSWIRYCGIDSGSGGEANDPAAIVFVAVSPDYRRGRVYNVWRGDGVETTASDIIMKYLEMRGTQKIELTVYDYADKDLHTIATRMGLGFTRADKSHDRGEGILNTLFKNQLLALYRTLEMAKLITELITNKIGMRKPIDHLSDALRYVCALIPWDWSIIDTLTAVAEPEKELTEDDLRRGRSYEDREEYSIEAEFDEINSLYDDHN
jgi:hypothetical protein